MSLMYHRVTIPFEDIDHALGLYKNLQKRGVSFDIGFGPEGMDWELDWSIKGYYTAQDILLELEDLGIDYTVTLERERKEDE